MGVLYARHFSQQSKTVTCSTTENSSTTTSCDSNKTYSCQRDFYGVHIGVWFLGLKTWPWPKNVNKLLLSWKLIRLTHSSTTPNEHCLKWLMGFRYDLSHTIFCLKLRGTELHHILLHNTSNYMNDFNAINCYHRCRLAQRSSISGHNYKQIKQIMIKQETTQSFKGEFGRHGVHNDKWFNGCPHFHSTMKAVS